MNTTGLLAAGVAASLSMATVPHAAAQEHPLDEIKKEVMRRAGHINPFEGIRREDAAPIIASLDALTIDVRERAKLRWRHLKDDDCAARYFQVARPQCG